MRRSVLALPAAAVLLLAAQPAAAQSCNTQCLNKAMDGYLDNLIKRTPAAVPLAPNANLRENVAAVKLGEGVWKSVKSIKARQDFADPVSGQVWSFLGVELTGGEIAQMSERLKVVGGKITEVETIINTGGAGTPYPGGPFLKENVLEPDVLFTAPVPKARQSSRKELIEIANGYFEALAMLDAGAGKFGVRCVRFESGAGGGVTIPRLPTPGASAPIPPPPGPPRVAPTPPPPTDGYLGRYSNCSNGLDGRVGQQTMERRFPVAIPELGIVIGYMFIMHHERTPPADNFINEIFKVVDGKIRQIDAVGWQATAPMRSGYTPDFPYPGVIRGVAKTVTPFVAPPSKTAQLTPGMPKAPYPGLGEVRDFQYGPYPQQTLDILYPTAKAAKPRGVVVFVHGGGWQGGDKHAPGDDLYENVALWAAKQGFVAFNINYRLADYANGKNLYPTQEQDISTAIDWIGSHAVNYGGDPNRIFAWGHSAGGSMLASAVSDPKLYGNSPGVKGVFLLSAPLDMTLDEGAGRAVAYYGKTHEEFVGRSPLTTLAKSKVPVLLGYSSDETGLVPQHAEKAKTALCAAGHCPTTVMTKGSHQGEMMAVGTADTLATDAFLAFMKSVP